VVGGASQPLSIPANSEGRALFRLVADPAVGIGNVRIKVNGLGEQFLDVTEIAVRPPSTLQKATGSGSITGGSSQRITIGLSDFMKGSTDYQLVVSRSPVVELGDQLRYLVQYPYGCTEQTISAAFPQLYYGDLADLMRKGRGAERMNANSHIIEAIRKIKMGRVGRTGGPRSMQPISCWKHARQVLMWTTGFWGPCCSIFPIE
jgi:uncharacterized protein YfaS (alpha-2-macroglobulin family)